VPAATAASAGTSRWAGWCFGLVVLLSLAVLFGPSTVGDPVFPGADKVVHLTLFALLAGTARWRFGGSAAALGLVVAYAPVSELVQGTLLSGRSGDPLDVVADLAGTAIGWSVVGWRRR
jgi:hypothetical protein